MFSHLEKYALVVTSRLLLFEFILLFHRQLARSRRLKLRTSLQITIFSLFYPATVRARFHPPRKLNERPCRVVARGTVKTNERGLPAVLYNRNYAVDGIN